MTNDPFFTGLDKMKKASTSGGELRLNNDEKVVVKFLDDIDGEYPIAQYYSHFVNKELGSYPCVEDIYGECPLCAPELNIKKRYQLLANVAVITPSGNTVSYIRKGREFVGECLTPYLEEYGTLTDRYYSIRGESRTLGATNYIAFKMVPVELPKDCKAPKEENLRRVDWKTFLIIPKLEALKDVAEQIREE
jgi:hypothetical protein